MMAALRGALELGMLRLPKDRGLVVMAIDEVGAAAGCGTAVGHSVAVVGAGRLDDGYGEQLPVGQRQGLFDLHCEQHRRSGMRE